MSFPERRWDQWLNGSNEMLVMFIKKDQQSFIITKAILDYNFRIRLPQCVILKKNRWLYVSVQWTIGCNVLSIIFNMIKL